MNITRRILIRCILRVGLGPLVSLAFNTHAQDPVLPEPTGSDRPFVQAIRTQILSLNPFALTGIEPYQIAAYITESLATIDPQSRKLKPFLAEAWTVSKDRKTVRVKIRKDAFFHNGQPVTASDVVFTWSSYMGPQSERMALWRPMFEQVEKIDVVTDHEFDVVFKNPSYQAFKNFMTTLRVLPKFFYEKASAEVLRTKMIGSGPYQLEGFEPGRVLSLKPFAKWWGWKAFKLKPQQGLRIKTFTDMNLVQGLLQKGEVDFFEARDVASASSADFCEGTKCEVRWVRTILGQGFGLDLNLKNPILKSPKVREALLLLWDREALKKIYGSRYFVALDFFSAGLPGYPEGKAVAMNRDKARALLAEEDWKDLDKNGILENSKGEELKIPILATSAVSDRWLSLYQENARQVGVKIELQRMDEGAQYWTTLKEGKYVIRVYEGGLSDAVHSNSWQTGGGYNFSGFSSAKVDEALKKLESEFDEDKRLRAQREMILEIRKTNARIPGLSTLETQVWVSKSLVIDSNSPTLAWRWRRKI